MAGRNFRRIATFLVLLAVCLMMFSCKTSRKRKRKPCNCPTWSYQPHQMGSQVCYYGGQY